MLSLVLLLTLMGFTSASPQGYFLPSGTPYLHGNENRIPYSSPIQLHPPVLVPLPVLARFDSMVQGVADVSESHTGQKEIVNVEEDKKVELADAKISTASDSVITPDTQAFAQRQIVFRRLFPALYTHPQQYVHVVNGESLQMKRVSRQVLGSPVWDRKVIDWGSKNCPPLPLIGGAVAGASGGPVGVALGVIGAGIGACNFN